MRAVFKKATSTLPQPDISYLYESGAHNSLVHVFIYLTYSPLQGVLGINMPYTGTSGILAWEKLFYLLHKARKLFSSLKLTGP